MECDCPVWFLHTAKNINCLKHVQHQAARWASGSRWNPSSYCSTKSSDDCLVELKWHQCHACLFLSAKFITFYIITTLLTTSSYPILLLDHIHWLFNPFHHTSIPTIILFCKQSILMESYSFFHPQDLTVQFILLRSSLLSFMIFLCN